MSALEVCDARFFKIISMPMKFRQKNRNSMQSQCNAGKQFEAVRMCFKILNEKLQEVTSNFLSRETAFGYLLTATFWIFVTF